MFSTFEAPLIYRFGRLPIVKIALCIMKFYVFSVLWYLRKKMSESGWAG
jgi:hypothetical protein